MNQFIYYFSNIFLYPLGLYKKIKGKLTKDILLTFSNSLWRIVSGPVSLIFIPLFLNPQTQGYWYTFVSIAALAIFADLGFTTIVSQFSAHEFAHLKFNMATRQLEGDELYIKRISSLFRFVIKWAMWVSLIGFPIILLVGFLIFFRKHDQVDWIIPWIIYVLVSGFNFTLGTVLSFLEGCNQIAAIQKNRFISAIVASVSTWAFLATGFNLYTLAFTALLGSVLSFVLLYQRFNVLLRQFFRKKIDITISWSHDFLKLIWKYAISWCSGYFIFQIYVPLTFSNFGSVEAGKVGISMTLATAMFAIANVWVYVSTPKFNMMASRKDWAGMDKLLKSSIFLSAITFFLGALLVLSILYFFSDQIHFLQRFLGFKPMAILLSSWFIQIIVNTIASYLRAHKQEPMVWLSLVSAIFIATSTFILSRFFKPDYLFLGFLLSQLFVLPSTLYILKNKRLQWH